ncbi:MAG TPA: LuxR C-terminal-related transcriptional regulator [Solirubrobacteraceae bacterium]|jgi:predicted ATPase/DNA-binding CsgD family transcriptional regulator
MDTGPLIGREFELAELEGMLGGTRLLTIAGAGGCGKTRLALELARRRAKREQDARCVIVPLAGVGSQERLIEALLGALGARERFGSTATQVLLDHVAARRMLLVLDNCEHMLGTIGALAAQLLQAGEALQLLATSREPLSIDGESVFRLNPLRLPNGGDVASIVHSDAGRLFVDRATASNPDFALTPAVAQAVAEICRELDGLPHAIVLAASRLDTLTVEQIASGLSRQGRLAMASGGGERAGHISLRASLDWSYQLLEAEQQALLRRLSVFSGSFTTVAAQAVAAPGEHHERVRHDLQALAAKGLLMPADAYRQERWILLQTVAEYAAEQLAGKGEADELAERHLEFFRASAAQADRSLLERHGHKLVDEDAANFQAALDRARTHTPGGALEIAAGLMRHWILAEHFQQAHSTSAAVLPAAGEHASVQASALVQCGGGLVRMLGEDYQGAIESTYAGLALVERVQDAGDQASCLVYASMVLIQTGLDLNEGLRSIERAVELAKRADDPLGLGFALVTLAVAAGLCERFDAVNDAYEQFLAIPRACEHPRLRTWAEQAAAWVQVSIGSPERSLAHIERALALEGDWPSMTHFQIVGFRIQALAIMGRTDQALAEGNDALHRARRSRALQALPAIELALMIAQLMDGDLDAAELHSRSLLAMPQQHTLALAHATLAKIALARLQPVVAHEHAGQLEALAERLGSARQHALVQHIDGCAALQAGETTRGRDLLHASLETCVERGFEREAIDALDELALLAVQTDEIERGARLAGAATAARVRLRCVVAPHHLGRLEAARSLIVDRGEGECWQAAWAQGQALELSGAIAYARRGRGPRDRPSAGWASLTPVETKVAQLAASGMTNPQIATELFIARGTVKMHLSSIYRKLDVANRTELATVAATRSSSPDAAYRFA